MDLVEKYRPRTLLEVRGNRKAVEELRQWALHWPSDKLAALLYGKPGTGKTSAAAALAADMGWQLLELNASDKRTQGIINETAGEASKSASLLNTQKLILLDEIDNLHGTSDRGGAKAVTELVKKTRAPVILTANDLYSVSPTLRGYCKQIAFFAIREQSAQKALLDIWHNERRETLRAQEAVADVITHLEQPERASEDTVELKAISADLDILSQLDFDLEVLRKIHKAQEAAAGVMARLEQPERNAGGAAELKAVTADLQVLTDLSGQLRNLQETLSDVGRSLEAVDVPLIAQIAKNANGDLRSAITDFQAYIGGAHVGTAARDRAQSAFDLMRSIFNDRDPTRPLTISYAVDQTPEDLVHWIDENLPRALEGEGLAHAYQVLGRADIYLGRTRKRQHYGLWRYAAELMTSGVNVAAHHNHGRRNAAAKYSPPTHWMRLGQTRSRRALRDGVASKIASANHVSAAKAREEIVPLYKEFALIDAAGITAALNLSAEELAFLMSAKKDAVAVKKALEEAERLIGEQMPKHEPIPEHGAPVDFDTQHSRPEDYGNSASELRISHGSKQPAADLADKRKTEADRGQKYLDEY
ncbi:MAG: AAA family ATPase [Halobacteriota archaeon]|jgi:DNA polymerase III delta prime subunit